MDNYIKSATEQFETLLREQVARTEKMAELSKPVDYANLDTLIIGVCDGDGIGPIICREAVRVLEYKNGVVSEGTFSFTDSGEITLPVQVGKAVASGIMEGMADGSFAPQNNSTRAEAVTVIKRMRD